MLILGLAQNSHPTACYHVGYINVVQLGCACGRVHVLGSTPFTLYLSLN